MWTPLIPVLLPLLAAALLGLLRFRIGRVAALRIAVGVAIAVALAGLSLVASARDEAITAYRLGPLALVVDPASAMLVTKRVRPLSLAFVIESPLT